MHFETVGAAARPAAAAASDRLVVAGVRAVTAASAPATSREGCGIRAALYRRRLWPQPPWRAIVSDRTIHEDPSPVGSKFARIRRTGSPVVTTWGSPIVVPLTTGHGPR